MKKTKVTGGEQKEIFEGSYDSYQPTKKCPHCKHISPDAWPFEAGFKFHEKNCPWYNCHCDNKKATRRWYGCCSEECLGNVEIIVV